MSANLVPSPGNSAAAARPAGVSPMQQWGAPPPQQESGVGEQITRSLSALRRYKWLVLAVIAVGSTAGLVLTHFVSPNYEVTASIWIATDKNSKVAGGPIAAPGLVQSDAGWMELVRSYAVLDRVVGKLALYVIPDIPGDTLAVRGLYPADSLQAGLYAVKVRGDTYELVHPPEQRGEKERLIEKGTLGDSIGRSVGFLWHPDPAQLKGHQYLGFYVMTPREAAYALSNTMTATVAVGSPLLRLQLDGTKPGMLATTLNTLAREFVREAGRLQRENLTAQREATEDQLRQAAAQLSTAQSALEKFKINTITEPSEATAVAPGVSTTLNPVFTAYFNDRVSYDVARTEREAIERITNEAKARGGRISIEALRSIPSAMTGNVQLQTAVTDLNAAQTNLSKLREKFTDEYRIVKDVKSQIDRLEAQTIPALVASSLLEMRSREAEYKRRVDGASQELKKIPSRTVEEMRLTREMSIAGSLYTDLQQRAVGARLSEQNALPDVSILDTAVAPRFPTTDTTTGIILVAVAASVGLGLALALLLDRLDKRFRYPEQATHELGLDIVGAIPSYKNPSNAAARLEEASQLIESFRSIALSIRSAFDGIGPVQLVISSPGPGDGKSFVSANLASALADSGYRTLLIDGDIRRGALHDVFPPCAQSPGLIDYLAGEATLSDVVRPTQQHVNLTVLPCGTRRRHGPELLASDRMTSLIREMRAQFDAIIVDTAPLGAGIDAYALGTATGSMVLVLRAGETDRKLAQAKLTVLDRMPVRMLGAILNDIGTMPQFKYYYYLEGYRSFEGAEDGAALITAGNGNGKEHG